MEITPSDMCGLRKLRSDCADAQSDLSLCCPPEEHFDQWLSREGAAKNLMSLCKYAGWSVSSMCAHVKRYIFFCQWLNIFSYSISSRKRDLTTCPIDLKKCRLVYIRAVWYLSWVPLDEDPILLNVPQKREIFANWVDWVVEQRWLALGCSDKGHMCPP